MINFPKTVTVEIDTLEKMPFKMPTMIEWWPTRGDKSVIIRVKTEEARLIAGDYRLQEWPHLAGIERKRSSLELYSNCVTADRHRANNAFARMSDTYMFPYLLVEENPSTMLQTLELPRPMHEDTVQGGLVADRLFETVTRHNLSLIWGGRGTTPQSRKCLAELMLRILLRHAFDYEQRLS